MTHARRALGASGKTRSPRGTKRAGYECWPATGAAATASSTSWWVAAPLFVFCEVKTRTSDAFGVPAEAVTRTKQARLRRLGAHWLEQAGGRGANEIRFDVASVLAGNVEVIEAAF